MENRYLYRGKQINNGEWVVGNRLDAQDGRVAICETNGNWKGICPCIPDTVCQCTGYEGIYEKDIFRCEDEDYVVKWSDDSLSWEAVSLFTDVSVSLAEFNPDYIDVIGNEIDNPELLEV